MVFISEFNQKYIQARAAGCIYLDTILAFWLLDAVNLSEEEEKFIFMVVDF